MLKWEKTRYLVLRFYLSLLSWQLSETRRWARRALGRTTVRSYAREKSGQEPGGQKSDA